ncbi:MAG: iron-binding protein [Candidatus Marinimicrobia bacterium]|nr:iron-binding protein [Candidatus Neomarinimicrobiota bacterium]MAV92881.1 iron-binding protein [Candidatus Neomarinimicrobiota bacterium]
MIKLKINKGQKYSICTCGISKNMPFCDNQHRAYNKKNNCSYKSLKITIDKDDSMILTCSNWKNKNEK